MTDESNIRISHRCGLMAVSPIAVFLVLYLAVSVSIGDFYSMPISVALLVASAWAVATGARGVELGERVEIFSRGAGSATVIYMVWIFILAGAFATLARQTGSVEATVQLALRYMPPSMVVPGLFMGACFISLAIGTSVGTVVALTPLAVEMAQSEGEAVPFFVAVVLGGAFFGDNLSFISDTTIAATRTQGCRMADKFRANVRIALPAALVALGLYVAIGAGMAGVPEASGDVSAWLVVPYLVVIALALFGVNVTVVLASGIVVAFAVGLVSGFDAMALAGYMGEGIDSVGPLVIITLMAAGMLSLIRHGGGIDYLLQVMTRHIRGRRGAMCVMAMLVGVVNLCTANNTVAILTVGEISAGISRRFGISARTAASLLDTCSCVVQSLIPYGAQTLMAAGLAGISPVAPWPYLYYPWALAAMVALLIALTRRGRGVKGDVRGR